MKLATHRYHNSIVSVAFLLLFVGCSSISDDFVRGTSGWRERSTGAPKLLSPVSKTTEETLGRKTTVWRERSIETPKLVIPRTAQPEGIASVEVVEDKRKSEGSLTGSSSSPVSLTDSETMSELQSAWSKLSPEELVEQLEKGLYKEEVQAILHSASVVEVVTPWGNVWVMGSDTPPVFFDVRGRLIDWGWFEYHNLVADLDPAGDSLALPIRIVKQPSFNDIMPLPKSNTAF